MRPEIIGFEPNRPVRLFVRNVEQIPYHWHQTLELVLVLQGSVGIGFGAEEHFLHAGQMAVVNVDEVHRFFDGSPDNRVAQIHIDPAYCEKGFPGFSDLLFYCCSAYEDEESRPRYERLGQGLQDFVKAFREGALGEGLPQKLDGLIACLIEDFDLLRWGLGNMAYDERRRTYLQRISSYLKEHFREKLELKEVARVAGIGPHHFSHMISEQFDYTFYELLTHYRLEEAVKGLLSSGLRIVDIALSCGFSDVKYLNQAFKKYYGCTPSEFRKRYSAKDDELAGQIRYRELL